MTTKTTTQAASVQGGRKQIDQLETGSASLFIELKNGTLDVYHGEGPELLFSSKVKLGTWDALWASIIGGIK